MKKPYIVKVKDSRGRRIVAYRACWGVLEASGPTPGEARRELEQGMAAALERLEIGTQHGRFRHWFYTVEPTLYGWDYRIQDSPRVSGYKTREEAHARALYNLAQQEWQHEDDDEAFARELGVALAQAACRAVSPVLEFLDWVAWQRRYQACRQEGHTDREAHRLATEGGWR